MLEKSQPIYAKYKSQIGDDVIDAVQKQLGEIRK
jgi:hypothetical protein